MENAADSTNPKRADVNELALETARKIMGIDQAALVGGDTQHLATIQCLVRDALTTPPSSEIALYWYQRAGEHRDSAELMRERAIKAERALIRNGFTDEGGEEWKPPVGTIAGELQQRVFHLEGEVESAYEERNRVVAALAKCFPAGITRTDIPGWDAAWHGCVRIDLPTGQVSWHYHDDHAHLFAHLPPYGTAYDGHTTAAKYTRLAALRPEPSTYEVDSLVALLHRRDSETGAPPDGTEESLTFYTQTYSRDEVIRAGINALRNASRAKRPLTKAEILERAITTQNPNENTIWPQRIVRVELTHDTIGDERASPDVIALLRLVALRMEDGDMQGANARMWGHAGWRAQVTGVPMLDPTVIEDGKKTDSTEKDVKE